MFTDVKFTIYINYSKFKLEQKRKRPLDTPKRMMREGEREKERQKERYREGGRNKRERERGERNREVKGIER